MATLEIARRGHAKRYAAAGREVFPRIECGGMHNQSSKEDDVNQLAANIVSQATGENDDEKPPKNPAAVALGRLGGLKGGKARAAKLSPEQRSEIAKKAALAMWGKVK